MPPLLEKNTFKNLLKNIGTNMPIDVNLLETIPTELLEQLRRFFEA